MYHILIEEHMIANMDTIPKVMHQTIRNHGSFDQNFN